MPSTRSVGTASSSAPAARPSRIAFSRARSSLPSVREITIVATPLPITLTSAGLAHEPVDAEDERHARDWDGGDNRQRPEPCEGY
ncbi:hypothetical protein BJS_08983 [Bradyrhizobium japonicum SEMIA 5079]|nr:hypothetical protein BJS_08983 [Bradyrhizobium japonicum SEMIA 5079]